MGQAGNRTMLAAAAAGAAAASGSSIRGRATQLTARVTYHMDPGARGGDLAARAGLIGRAGAVHECNHRVADQHQQVLRTQLLAGPTGVERAA